MTERRFELPVGCVAPDRFPSPFDMEPHSIAQAACRDLQEQLVSINQSDHDFFTAGGGKMFGVLVVKQENVIARDIATEQCARTTANNGEPALVYLAAFSGMLGGKWQQQGFAPPAFDLSERERILAGGEKGLSAVEKEIARLQHLPERADLQQSLVLLQTQCEQALADARHHYQQRRQQRSLIRAGVHYDTKAKDRELSLQSQRDKSELKTLKRSWALKIDKTQARLDRIDQSIVRLKHDRKLLSASLQRQLFSGYHLRAFNGSSREVTGFFDSSMPPGGTGDCASIKLLQWCTALNLVPVCMAEFWWGAAPPGGIRHHRHYYPACRGKCRPILPHMLSGLSVSPATYETLPEYPPEQPLTLYEDEHILVLVKPAGMLSVAGKVGSDSVEHRLRLRYPELVPQALSRLLVHRLDQATSGLLVAAKNAQSHKSLHQQFERREVGKRYVADVDTLISLDRGVIDLPLRVDLEDRPRQMVCREHGKAATTRFQVLYRSDSQTRLYLYPTSGRTHQLRVHLAHAQGLNAPIIGDELYGTPSDRLRLHAEQLRFNHPVTNEPLTFTSPVPFQW